MEGSPPDPCHATPIAARVSACPNHDPAANSKGLLGRLFHRPPACCPCAVINGVSPIADFGAPRRKGYEMSATGSV
jgi:hypothetical protein